MKNSILIWIIKLTAVIILVQTLYFKFTGAEESIYIFSTLGVEPYGRIGTGIAELITVILILIPRTSLFGAIMGCGIMVGAIFAHLFVLGIEVNQQEHQQEFNVENDCRGRAASRSAPPSGKPRA